MKRKYISRILFTGVSVIACVTANAVPADPRPVKAVQADGSVSTVRLIGDEHFHYALSEDGRPLVCDNGFYRYACAERVEEAVTLERLEAQRRDAVRNFNYIIKENSARLTNPGVTRFGDFITEGSPKVLVILVEFDDVRFSTPEPQEYFSRMLSERGFSDYGATGSVLDYMMENSDGQFTPEFEVVGPVRLSRPLGYYGGNSILGGGDTNAHFAVTEACELLNNSVDFSRYDNNGNGVIDGVCLIHAGHGEASGGGADSIWAHTSWLSVLESVPHIFDGVRLDTYAVCDELYDGHPEGAGVFIHEFSHVLGLPDIYTSDKTTFTPGNWSVLDTGPYLNERRTPPAYSSLERYLLGWISPRELNGPDILTLPAIEKNVACCVKASGDEMYLFENRQNSGWDTYLPGHGMLVWHTDYNLDYKFTVNRDPDHQHIDLVEADGILSADTRSGDSFPGDSGITSFTDDTAPSMRSWSGLPLNVPITEISETDGLIRFKVCGGLVEVATPEKPVVSDVTPRGASLSWKPVEKAVDYVVTIRRADGEAEPEAVRTGGPAVFSAEDMLEPETEYYCGVSSVGPDGYVSEMSEEAQVVTPAMSFEFMRPVPVGSVPDSNGGFTAKWEELPGADSYEISVWGIGKGEPYVLTEGFDGGSAATGWESSGCLALSNASYAGASVPSLKMSPDARISSPLFEDDVWGLRLWVRAISPAAGAFLEVEALCGSEWVCWGSLDASSTEGKTVALDAAPSGCRAVRLTLRASGGALAIDDVEISWGANETELPEDKLMGVDAGNALSFHVVPGSALTRFRWSVTGVSGSMRSLPSVKTEVAVESGMPSVSQPCRGLYVDGRSLRFEAEETRSDVEVTDIAGRILMRCSLAEGETVCFTPAASGILIVRFGGKTARVVMR